MADTYETIRTWILHGVLEPGQRLLETQLAEQMGISRTPIREALRRLEIEGLIQFSPNRGAVVKKYTQEEIHQIFDLRILLEGFAAQQAACHRTDEQGEEIQSLNHRFKSLYEAVNPAEILEAQIDEFVEINARFHRVIWVASGNPQLPAMLERLIVIPLTYKSYHKYTHAQMGHSLRAHELIGDAILKKDPMRAEIAMKEHVLVGRDHAFSIA